MSKKQESELNVGSWGHLKYITPSVLVILALIGAPLAIFAEFMTGEATFGMYVSAALFGALLCAPLAWLILFLPGYFIYGFFYNLKK